MILETVVVGPMQVNCYILANTNACEAILIDPGAEPEKIKNRLNKLNLKPKFIVNTHGHIDHIEADGYFGVEVLIHQLDLEFLKKPRLNLSQMFSVPFVLPGAPRAIEDKEELRLGEICLQVIHTPGHTPGGICLYHKQGKILFSGDTLFASGVGRTDLPLASEEELWKSIRSRLFTLADDVLVYPGHGPSTVIGQEKKAMS